MNYSESNNAIAGRIGGREAGPGVSPAMLKVDEVATILGCSARHVWRLADSKQMPRPAKLGNLRRWPRQQIDAWIAGGCPDCKEGAER